jgi:hypothetical protein
MKQIKVRWGDLGSPVQPGTHRCGPHMVEVTPGDINLAKDNTRCSPRSTRTSTPMRHRTFSPASTFPSDGNGAQFPAHHISVSRPLRGQTWGPRRHP